MLGIFHNKMLEKSIVTSSTHTNIQKIHELLQLDTKVKGLEIQN